MEQDEIYLIDLWRILLREWRWFIAVLALILACAFALTHFAKPQWEATAWVQIGQVGQVGQMPSGQDQMVEPLQRVLERLQMVPFENDVMKSVGFAPDSAEAGLYRNSLKLEPLPYAGPLIRLSVRAHSPQQAHQFAMATVTQLQAIHQPIEAMSLNAAHARLDQIQADLQGATAEQVRLMQAATSANKGDATGKDTANAMLANMLLASKNKEVRDLKKASMDLTDRLSPAYTYETSMPWPIYVPRRQVFPNPALALGIGILLGVFLGACAAIARNVARRRASVR
ncbi:MAG: Wzz/FepE/Etk N-terminal domain-containing protein [Rhodanobacter sp.]